MSIIKVENLIKTYQIYHKQPGLMGSVKSLVWRQSQDLSAVDNVSFEIEPGEVVGFIGPNGAGKTTTLKMLSGLLTPTSGHVSVMGFIPWQRQNEFRRQFSLVAGQKNQLWWDLPAIESFNLSQVIYQIPQKQYRKTLNHLVDLMGVAAVLDVQVRKLSLGQRMKCELITALLHRPRVLYLDEPTIGLDVVMQKTVREFIKEYNKTYEATVILTSHYMDDVKELSKRVLVIDGGKLVFDGNLTQLISKYARNKLLSLVLSKSVSASRLEEYGKVTTIGFPKVQLTIPRQSATETAAKMLKNLPIIDLTIEEPPIEAIIREVFTKED